jgi:hypothetical protein
MGDTAKSEGVTAGVELSGAAGARSSRPWGEIHLREKDPEEQVLRTRLLS